MDLGHLDLVGLNFLLNQVIDLLKDLDHLEEDLDHLEEDHGTLDDLEVVLSLVVLT